MKWKTESAFFCWLAVLQSSTAKTVLRRNLEGEGQENDSAILCKACILEEDLGGGITDVKLACQMSDHHVYEVAVDDFWLNRVLHNYELVSGVTILSLANYKLVGTVFRSTTGRNNPPGLMQMAEEDEQQRRELAAVTGTRTVLAVRVNHNGSGSLGAPTYTEETLSDDVFGDAIDGGTNYPNLHSQYLECSNNKLDFQPTPSRKSLDPLIANDILNGVTTVTIHTDCPAELGCNVAMENDVSDALEEAFGVDGPEDLADHVLYCLPNGSMKGIAYAHVNGAIAVYRDVWCLALSAVMHEVGHNLNLNHSGENKYGLKMDMYGDKSGMMGYSFKDKKGPKRCLNGPKNWQLGWYSEYHHEFHAEDEKWEGNLVGISEIAGMSTSANTAIVKINDPDENENDYFVSFNRKSGPNADTKEGVDQVLVVQRGGEVEAFSESWRLADLNQGQSYTTASGVTIAVHSIDTKISPAEAKIRVSYPNFGSYIALPEGRDGSVSITTMEECKVAGLEAGGKLRRGKVVGPGRWRHVPCGCSLQGGSEGDKSIHFKDDFSSCGQTGTFIPVVKVAYFKLPEGSDGSTSISSIEECKAAGLKVGGVLIDNKVKGPGTWSDVPCGCSIQSSGNNGIYFKNEFASCGQGNDSKYSPIVRRDDSYVTLPESSGGTDSIRTIEECMVAGLSVGGILREGAVLGPGVWPSLPCGCSIPSGPGGDKPIHFKDDFNSCESSGGSGYLSILKNDFFRLPEGSDGSDSIVNIEECRVAGLAVGGILRNGVVQGPGTWANVPCGCSIQSGQGGDKAIHFKTDFNSCGQPSQLYAPVVRF